MVGKREGREGKEDLAQSFKTFLPTEAGEKKGGYLGGVWFKYRRFPEEG